MPAAGLVIAAVPERGDPRDALVGHRLADLPDGATVATGSVRRQAQLAHVRPDLRFVDLRGNIQTRLAKVPPGGAIVMAVAALERLGLADHIAEALEPSVMLPQVAQGALAAECREDDDATLTLLRSIEHAASRAAVDGERAFLAGLGGGCDLPVGAHVTLTRAGGVARGSSPMSRARPCSGTPRSVMIRSRSGLSSRQCSSARRAGRPF